MRFGMGYASWTGGPGMGGRGRHGGRPGGGPRGRVLGGDELKLVLLALIAQAPRHGYDLIRAVEADTGGAYAPSPGVVYPTLTLLTDMGLIEEQASEGNRKRFAVTEAGTAQLASDADQVADLFARLKALGEHRARTDAGPIHRARANLRAALHHRLSGENVDVDTLHAVAAILDEAAQKVERL